MTGSSPGLNVDTVSATELGEEAPSRHAAVPTKPGRLSRLRSEWEKRLNPAQQAVVLSWASFTSTFVVVRGLTHWIKGGHGPSGGGMSVGGQHFHHYNIGIALLCVVGGVGLRGAEKHRRHPATAIAYGSATALIVDELALLLDLKDVYWANDGRKSVDAAVTLIAAGGLTIAGLPLWPHARRALKST